MMFRNTVTDFESSSVVPAMSSSRNVASPGAHAGAPVEFRVPSVKVTWHTPGVNALSVLFVATAAGCAGGVVRDVMIDKPTLVLANELYVTPVILGAAALMLAERLGAAPLVAFAVAMIVTTTLRVLAIRFEWRLPRIPAFETPAPLK